MWPGHCLRRNKYIQPTISTLGLLQVVDTVKTKALRLVLGDYVIVGTVKIPTTNRTKVFQQHLEYTCTNCAINRPNIEL